MAPSVPSGFTPVVDTTVSFSCALPANVPILANDLLVWFQGHAQTSTVTSVPTGFVQLTTRNNTAATQSAHIGVRIAQGGEEGTTYTAASSATGFAVLHVIRPDTGYVLEPAIGSLYGTTAGTGASLTCTAGAATTLATSVGLFCGRGTSGTGTARVSWNGGTYADPNVYQSSVAGVGWNAYSSTMTGDVIWGHATDTNYQAGSTNKAMCAAWLEQRPIARSSFWAFAGG